MRADSTTPAATAEELFRTDSLFVPQTLHEWHVLRTKCRQEKILFAELQAIGVGAYLPLISEVRFYAGRKAKVEVPIFPGYVFLRGSIEQAHLADRTKRVAQVLHVCDQVKLNSELRNIF